MLNKIEALELKKALDAGEDLLLLDVRENEELEEDKIRTHPITHIPLAALTTRHVELPQGRNIVVLCRSGGRSAQACHYLMSQGFKVTNLEGGMLSWRSHIPEEPELSEEE